jgi:hypothetical protein
MNSVSGQTNENTVVGDSNTSLAATVRSLRTLTKKLQSGAAPQTSTEHPIQQQRPTGFSSHDFLQSRYFRPKKLVLTNTKKVK